MEIKKTGEIKPLLEWSGCPFTFGGQHCDKPKGHDGVHTFTWTQEVSFKIGEDNDAYSLVSDEQGKISIVKEGEGDKP